MTGRLGLKTHVRMQTGACPLQAPLRVQVLCMSPDVGSIM